MNSIHILMGACVIVGLTVGALAGWLVTSYTYEKELEKMNQQMLVWLNDQRKC
jgi:hypothetical protein